MTAVKQVTAQFRGLSTQSGYAVMSHSWQYTGTQPSRTGEYGPGEVESTDTARPRTY